MIYYLTTGVLTASAGTGVPTLCVRAGEVRRAIGVQHALGSATLLGIPYVALNTATGTRVVLHSALSVRAARRWCAGIDEGRLLD